MRREDTRAPRLSPLTHSRMHLVDWLIVAGYMVATLALGFYLSRRASGSMEDFFVSGRSLPWWLAGTSMAATTFSIDTPLLIAGLVGTQGIAGNWIWWSFIFAHVALIYLFARLWRRSEIVTDAELNELRYSGRSAAVLRASKAFLFAVLINCIGIGYAMLAAVKVVEGLGIYATLGIDAGDTVLGLDPKLLTVIGVSFLVLLYAGFSGLWGVVVTDFFQFFLGLGGAMVVAWYGVTDARVGGLAGLSRKAQALTDFDALSFVPITFGTDALFGVAMTATAGLSAWTFFAYVTVQWWTFRRSDGGGEFIQRLAAAKDETEAEKSAWFFNIVNYVVRTWPWVLVALAALVLYPELEDKELGYPRMMLDFLPVGILGLVVASLVAAFMSTISTLINWGASYLTNDLYRRFMNPGASQAQLVLAGRVASVVITALGATAAFFADSITTVFSLVIAIGTGPGVVLILRWFWWRINAEAELAAMVAGFVSGVTLTFVAEVRTTNPAVDAYFQGSFAGLFIDDFGLRLIAITIFTTIVWVSTMYLTRPESDATLDAFYAKVRPGGPGWRRQRERTGLPSAQALGLDVARTLVAVVLLFSLMFGVGAGFLLRWELAGGLLVLAVAAWAVLRGLTRYARRIGYGG